ncbi:MAG: hypothetical protein LBS07_01060 [Prevotellaceae bacterium]|nr:hypothetical protein [Prevotellaceae bacterium]
MTANTDYRQWLGDLKIGISEYKLAKLLPEDFRSSLPSIQEIEEKLSEI